MQEDIWFPDKNVRAESSWLNCSLLQWYMAGSYWVAHCSERSTEITMLRPKSCPIHRSSHLPKACEKQNKTTIF